MKEREYQALLLKLNKLRNNSVIPFNHEIAREFRLSGSHITSWKQRSEALYGGDFSAWWYAGRDIVSSIPGANYIGYMVRPIVGDGIAGSSVEPSEVMLNIKTQIEGYLLYLKRKQYKVGHNSSEASQIPSKIIRKRTNSDNRLSNFILISWGAGCIVGGCILGPVGAIAGAALGIISGLALEGICCFYEKYKKSRVKVTQEPPIDSLNSPNGSSKAVHRRISLRSTKGLSIIPDYMILRDNSSQHARSTRPRESKHSRSNSKLTR